MYLNEMKINLDITFTESQKKNTYIQKITICVLSAVRHLSKY